MFGRPRFGQRGGGNVAAFALLTALWQLAARLPYKPPVTLLAAAAQAYLYFESPLSSSAACFSPARAAARGWLHPETLARALAAPLHHADDMHLYYNTASFLIKGASLEARLGSARFAAALTALFALTHVFYVALCLALGSRECGVGFSGVIFALKALDNADAPGVTNVGGIRLPTTLAAWGELVLIFVTVPRSSFLGHLAGILAGTAMAWGLRAASGRADATLPAVLRSVFGFDCFARGAAPPAGGGAAWACNRCAARNDAAAGACAACGERRRGTWGRGTAGGRGG